MITVFDKVFKTAHSQILDALISNEGHTDIDYVLIELETIGSKFMLFKANHIQDGSLEN